MYPEAMFPQVCLVSKLAQTLLNGAAVLLDARVTDLVLCNITASMEALTTGCAVILIHCVVVVHVAFEAASADARTATYGAQVGRTSVARLLQQQLLEVFLEGNNLK